MALNHLAFDYIVIANQCFDTDSLSQTFDFFSKLGIRKFIFLLNYSSNTRSLSVFKDQKRNLSKRLRSLSPRGTSVDLFANVEMSDGILCHPDISKLTAAHSNLLFLQMPYLTNADWVNSDLNHVLFKKQLSPILTSFEGNIHTNDPARIDQMFRSKYFRICLDLNYITALDAEVRIMQGISREIPIFPCISHPIVNYVGVFDAFEDLQRRMGHRTYARLCRNFSFAEFDFWAQTKAK